jgi:hypothetical protein
MTRLGYCAVYFHNIDLGSHFRKLLWITLAFLSFVASVISLVALITLSP